MPNVSVYMKDTFLQSLDKAAPRNRSAFIEHALEDRFYLAKQKKIRCKQCGKPITRADSGVVSWYEKHTKGGRKVFGFAIHHGRVTARDGRGPSCDDDREQRLKISSDVLGQWKPLEVLLTPQGFMNFIFNQMQGWDSGAVLEDFEGLWEVLAELSRFVFRRSTTSELECWQRFSMLLPDSKGSSRG